MPDTKITALTAIGANPIIPSTFPIPMVDLTDTSMAASGTTKKVTVNQILGAGGTATLASATITGDLTVDTSTLKVDSANNRVGINNASPTVALDVVGSGLISTGLVVGTSAANNAVDIVGPSSGSNAGCQLAFKNGATTNAAIGTYSRVIGGAYNDSLAFYSNSKDFVFYTGSERMRITSDGNVGIGVTPSAWSSSFKALQIGNQALWSVAGGNGYLSNNTTFNTSNAYVYRNNGFATEYIQSATNGVHAWFNAPSGTAGNAITFTQAMTLDASGRLGVGVVPASNTRTHFKGSSTSTDYINYCVNSSDKLAFGIRNDGLMITGSSVDSATLPNSPYNLTSGSAANVFVDSQGIFYRSTSSLKYKTDIADSTRGLADVLKLRPVTYKAKNSGDTVFGGLIAEEVDAAGLTEFVQYAPDNTPDAIHYGNMVSLLVAAIKELTARVQTLETR